MRLGKVIGRVTLSATVPALTGARWLIVSPFTREHFQRGSETPPGMSKDPSLVVYDDLGGGVGQTIGFVEGREAACPSMIQPRSMQSTPPWSMRFFTIRLIHEADYQRS